MKLSLTYLFLVLLCGVTTAQIVPTPCTGLDCSASHQDSVYFVNAAVTPKIIWGEPIGNCPGTGYRIVSQTAKITPGTPLPLRIVVSDPSKFGIWIDWNDNGLFEASENIYLTNGSPIPHLSSGLNTRTIPAISAATAIPGVHAIRFITVSTGSSPFTTADGSGSCGTGPASLSARYVYGHVQDFYGTVDGTDMKMAQIIGIPLTNIFSSAGTYPLTFKLDNVGVYDIDTCMVTWKLSNGSVNKPSNPGTYTDMMCPTCTSGGTSITASGGTYNFIHFQTLKIDSLGRDTICAWVTSIERGNQFAYQDKFHGNDTICNKALVFPKRDIRMESIVAPAQCPTSLFANQSYPVQVRMENLGDLALSSSTQDSMRFGYIVKQGASVIKQADTLIAISTIISGGTYAYTFNGPSALLFSSNGVYDITAWVTLNRTDIKRGNDTLLGCLRTDLNDCRADSLTVLGVSPFSIGNQYNVKLYVKNIGTKNAINPQVFYKVNGGSVVASVIPSIIAPGNTANVTFSTPFTPSVPGTYTVKSWIKMVDDLNPTNDTVTKTYTINLPPIDARPESVVAPIYIQKGVATPLKVWVENLGSSTMTSYTIEVKEQAAATPISTETVSGTLITPGSKILHTFAATYTPTKDTVILCFKTISPNGATDFNTANDVNCKTYSNPPSSIQSTIQNVSNIELYPNPNHGEFTLQFNLTKPQTLAIEVFNLNGQSVYSKTDSYNTSGAYVIPIELPQIPAGVYYCKIASDNQLVTKKVVIY